MLSKNETNYVAFKLLNDEDCIDYFDCFNLPSLGLREAP